MTNLSRGQEIRTAKKLVARVLSGIKSSSSSSSTHSKEHKPSRKSKPEEQPRRQPRIEPTPSGEPRDEPSCSNNAKQKMMFLALPAEIRLQIYDLLLVSRLRRGEGPQWAVGNSGQKVILLHDTPVKVYDWYKSMAPAILRTCRQVYEEAVPILYSQNVFSISAPGLMYQLKTRCGRKKFELIRSVAICVPHVGGMSKWRDLLCTLANEATGLRFMELEWAGRGTVWVEDAVMFMRALAKNQQLETLTISGYYAQHSAAYLKRKMAAVRVRAMYGYPPDSIHYADEHVNWLRRFKHELESDYEYPESIRYRRE